MKKEWFLRMPDEETARSTEKYLKSLGIDAHAVATFTRGGS